MMSQGGKRAGAETRSATHPWERSSTPRLRRIPTISAWISLATRPRTPKRREQWTGFPAVFGGSAWAMARGSLCSSQTRPSVVRRPGAEVTAERLRDHVARHLSLPSVPREIVFRSSLPKSLAGKVLKSALTAGPTAE